MSNLPQFLRDLADTLEGCEWNHPLGSAEMCRDAADRLENQPDPITPEIIAKVADLHGELREQAEEIERLREALVECVRLVSGDTGADPETRCCKVERHVEKTLCPEASDE